MEKKYVTIRNTSRGSLFLCLGTENNNKVIVMKPDSTAAITTSAWDYLVNACPNLFKNGDVQLVKKPIDVEVEEVEVENLYSNEDIAKLVEKNITAFKKEIAKIDSLSVLKDIRTKASEEGKTAKFMEAIDARIKELADGSILI